MAQMVLPPTRGPGVPKGYARTGRRGTSVAPPAITVAVSGLDATVTNTGGAATSINWGDGTTNTSLTHTYAAQGVYEVDAENTFGSSTKTVYVAQLDLDPNVSGKLFSDAAGTTPATSFVRRVVGSSSAGYVSGNTADNVAAVIDTYCYPGRNCLYFGGQGAPFPTSSGVGGSGHSFTLILDYLVTSPMSARSFGSVSPFAGGLYEDWTSSRYLQEISHAGFAVLAGPSSDFWIGRRRVIVRGTAGNLKFRINGIDYTTTAVADTAISGLNVGNSISDTLLAAGPLGRASLFNVAISDGMADLADAAMQALTTPIPFPLAIPLLVCDGNSILTGFGATAAVAWPQVVEGIVGRSNVRVSNLGAIGFQTATLATQAPTFVDVLYSASRTTNLALLEEGTNSMIAGVSGADTYASFVSWAAGRRSAGFLVAWANCPPSSLITGGQETQRLALNALLAANAATQTDGRLIDLASSPLADPADTRYYSDGTHFTAAGQAVAARRAAVTALAMLGLPAQFQLRLASTNAIAKLASTNADLTEY